MTEMRTHGDGEGRTDRPADGRALARELAACTLFAVAMAYVESAVVVYLREIVRASPDLFPLVPLRPELARIEIVREIATIMMLIAVALAPRRPPRIALAYFLYSFAIWDLFYYGWLAVLIAWPPSLLSWDVLFLIPAPWFGPVLSPCIVSLIFIAWALTALRLEALGHPYRVGAFDLAAGALGGIAVVASYLWELPEVARTGVPRSYPWWLFVVGIVVWIAAFALRLTRSARTAA